MALPKKSYEEQCAQDFGFVGMNANAAVEIVKKLVADWFNKEDVLPAIPGLQTAILSEPKLTLSEAQEIWHQMYGFYVGYFGSSEPQLSDLLHMIEDLYPEEVFE